VSPEVASIVCVTLYKLACLGVGALFCALGYWLFVLGVKGDAGDLAAGYGKLHMALKSAAPGTFFAVLGAVIVVVTVSHELKFNYQSAGGQTSLSTDVPAAQDSGPPPVPEPPGSISKGH
jgi:hypothetical protein